MARKYEKEFKVMISELLISGRKATELAQEYGLHESLPRKWRKQYESDKEAFTGSGTPSLTPEEKEIRRLRKQLREAELERDILKKAVSIFSKGDRRNTIS